MSKYGKLAEGGKMILLISTTDGIVLYDASRRHIPVFPASLGKTHDDSFEAVYRLDIKCEQIANGERTLILNYHEACYLRDVLNFTFPR